MQVLIKRVYIKYQEEVLDGLIYTHIHTCHITTSLNSKLTYHIT